MKRSIQRHIEEGHHIIRRKGIQERFSMTCLEWQFFRDRLEREETLTVCNDLFAFAFAVGHRAGRRDARKKAAAKS